MKSVSKIVIIGLISSISTLGYAADNSLAAPSDQNNTATQTKAQATPAPATPASPPPQSPITGNFDITNNYVFRGVSDSDNNPAVQGGLTYTFLTTGIYLNLWGSSTDFLSPQGANATVEFDTIAGITNSINDNFSYNIDLARYNYPRASGANYNELNAALTYKILTASIGFSPNVYGSHTNGTYYNGAISYPIPTKFTFNLNDVSLLASIGHYSLPHNKGLLSYNDYMVGLQKKIDKFTLSLQWTGTNGRNQTPPLDDDHIVGMVMVDI